jgi:hypothetical protein
MSCYPIVDGPFGHVATGHSCSLVTITLNAIRVFVFDQVVTTTNAVLCPHRANPSTVTPLSSDSPLRVCPDKDYRCVSLLSPRGRLTKGDFTLQIIFDQAV